MRSTWIEAKNNDNWKGEKKIETLSNNNNQKKKSILEVWWRGIEWDEIQFAPVRKVVAHKNKYDSFMNTR